jgi:hypothetical protein
MEDRRDVGHTELGAAPEPMGAAVSAGVVYFAVVFGVGFALGALRTLIVAPRLGETTAVLIEAPLMLAASGFAASWCVRRFEVPTTLRARLAMGAVAFGLLMAAEVGVSLTLFHRSLAQHLAGYGSTAGAVGLGAQVAFASVPLGLAWRSWDPLVVVRAVHTVIFVVMAAATFVVLYAAITGRAGAWVWVAAGLVGVESAVFLGNDLKCPLTAVAARYGAQGGADTFLPERLTRQHLPRLRAADPPRRGPGRRTLGPFRPSLTAAAARGIHHGGR